VAEASGLLLGLKLIVHERFVAGVRGFEHAPHQMLTPGLIGRAVPRFSWHTTHAWQASRNRNSVPFLSMW
jgi:hypothetical protein